MAAEPGACTYSGQCRSQQALRYATYGLTVPVRAGNSYFAAVVAGLKGYGGDNYLLGRLEAEAADAGKLRMLRGMLGEFIAEMVVDVRKAQREQQGVSDTAEAEELLAQPYQPQHGEVADT